MSRIIKQTIHQQYLASWTNTPTSNKLLSLTLNPLVSNSLVLKPRKNQVAFIRLLIDHTRLTHKYLLKREPGPFRCPLPTWFWESKIIHSDCASFVLFVLPGFRICATSYHWRLAYQFWVTGEMLAPNWFLGSKVGSMNCAQFVLFVLQGFKICAIFPSSLLSIKVWGAGKNLKNQIF